MGQITGGHIAGALLTLLLFVWLGIRSGRQVQKLGDFTTGGKTAGPFLVAGGILGTLIGGSATVGTAQLAVSSGFSGAWYTLGGACGCLAMAVFFAAPIRRSGCTTIQEIIGMRFGERAGLATSVLGGVGLVANIVSQMLAATALLTTIFRFGSWASVGIAVFMMSCYVVFGGVKGAGLLGTWKMILLYLVTLGAGSYALYLGGGLGAFYSRLEPGRYFSLFSRGLAVDGGAGLSAALGFLSTQSYLQAVVSGRNLRAARQGALLSACLAPPIGILSVFVGQYMVLFHPGLPPEQAFPQFLLTYMPPLAAGIALATLFIAVVGTGAGMALGLGTIFTQNIYSRFAPGGGDGRRALTVTRAVMLLAFALAAALAVWNRGTPILIWGFLSMGLRAVTAFFPLCLALFYPGTVPQHAVILSGILGLGAMLLCHSLPLPVDALLPGMAVSAAVLFCGIQSSRRKTV